MWSQLRARTVLVVPIIVAVIVHVVGSVATSATGPPEASDAVHRVIDGYDSALAGRLAAERSGNPLSPSETQQWRMHWLENLLQVAAEHPQSPNYKVALRKALGLATSSDQYESSEQIASMLAEAEAAPQERAAWLLELAEIKRMQYRQTKAAGDLQEALEQFRQAEAALRSVVETSRGDERQLAGERLILASAWLGDLLMLAESESVAAESYRQARDQISEFGQSLSEGSRLDGAGFSAEGFAHEELEAWARAGEVARGRGVLDYLKAHATEHPPSYYARRFASLAYGASRGEFQEFLEGWVKTEPTDAGTPLLLRDLGRSYFLSGACEEASRTYERVLRDHRDRLFEIDRDAILAGRGGYQADVMYDLVQCYARMKKEDRAQELIAEFAALYPNDPRVRILRTIGRTLTRQQQAGGMAQAPASPWRLWLIIGNCVALVGAAGYVARSRWTRARTAPLA